MSDRDSFTTIITNPNQLQAEILRECMGRHPAWISRLETDTYYPVAQIPITGLRAGDIIDVREFRVHIEEPLAFMTVDEIHADNRGIHGITGKLSNGNPLTIRREDGLPLRRRKVVRFSLRAPI